MEAYRYGVEGGKECRYELAVKNCMECLFQALCQFEQNKERRGSDTPEVDKIISKDLGKNM